MHEDLVSDGTGCPRQVERAAAARASHGAAPVIEEDIGVSSRGLKSRVDVPDRTQKGFHQCEGVDTQVLERIAAVPESCWKFAAAVRWVVGGAMKVDRQNVAADAASNEIEGPDN